MHEKNTIVHNGFYKTDGQVNWVKFDKDKYLDTILRNMKISVYILFIY